MTNFVCTPHAHESLLMVSMEIIHVFIVQTGLSLTTFFCTSGAPMNDLSPMKNCPWAQGRSNLLLGHHGHLHESLIFAMNNNILVSIINLWDRLN